MSGRKRSTAPLWVDALLFLGSVGLVLWMVVPR